MPIEEGRLDALTIYKIRSDIYKRINMLYRRRKEVLENICGLTEKARDRANNGTADRILFAAADLYNIDYMICEFQAVTIGLTYLAQKAGGNADE